MYKANKIYKRNLKNLINSEYTTKGHKVRPKYSDGNPAHTKYINQVVEKYDLSKNEFPIANYRPVAWKSAIREMLVIFQDQLNTREAFESKRVFWWEDWMNEDGNIGKAYPYNLESNRDGEQVREIVKVKTRIIDEKYKEKLAIHVLKVNKYNKENVICNHYITLKINKDNIKNIKYLLQDINTGEIEYVSHNAYDKLKTGVDFTKKSPFKYLRTRYGIGYIGNLNNIYNFSEEEINILKDKWVNMLKRTETYSQYKDVFVHQEWHSFENFLNDIRNIPQYHLAKEDNFTNWELDKDYFGSNCYSKYTCVFLKHCENTKYAKSKDIFVLIHPDGKEEKFLSINEACLKYKLITW
jgi:hypothetical protein